MSDIDRTHLLVKELANVFVKHDSGYMDIMDALSCLIVIAAKTCNISKKEFLETMDSIYDDTHFKISVKSE